MPGVLAQKTAPDSLGGAVNGLAGSGLVLQNNDRDDLPINTNGAFTFGTRLEDGAGYAVTVISQPTSPSQLCTVSNGAGTVSAGDVGDVVVTCIEDSAQEKIFLPVITR